MYLQKSYMNPFHHFKNIFVLKTSKEKLTKILSTIKHFKDNFSQLFTKIHIEPQIYKPYNLYF